MKRLWWRLVRLGFRLLYNEMAFTYDMVSWLVSLGAWRCWIGSALAHLGDESPVLELAHGTGNLQIDLHKAGYRAIGYDLSAGMGRIAQAKLAQHGIDARLTRGRAQQLPFASETFAAVVSTFPTDFIFAAATVNEVHRVLKAGGVFVIVPNAQLTGGDWSAKTLEWLYRITGQHRDDPTPPDYAAPFLPFQVKTVEERCSGSTVTVVIARKAL
jgi:ubiquinone/menaquinone biosynthesis C-methylase UbiE